MEEYMSFSLYYKTFLIYDHNDMASTIKLNYDRKALASVVNYDHSLERQSDVVIYDHNTFIRQATGLQL